MSLYEEMVQNGYATPTQPQAVPQPVARQQGGLQHYDTAEDRLRAAGIDPQNASQLGQGQPEPGLFQNVVRNIAKPFLNVGTSAYSAIGATGDIVQGNPQAAQEKLDKTYDFGYFGKAKPMGSVTPQEALTPEGVKTVVRDASSNALQLAPYTFGAGFTKPGMTLLQRMAAGGKGGVVTGGLSSLGTSIENRNSLPETAVNTATGMLGGGIVGSSIPLLTEGARRVFGATSGLGQKNLGELVKNPSIVDYGRDAIAGGGDDGGYYQLGQDLKAKLLNDKKVADEAWTSATSAFAKKNPNVRVNLEEQLGDVASPLREFGLSVARDAKNKISVVPDGPTGISNTQIGKISELLNKLSSYKALRPEQLPRVLQELSAAYEAVPQGSNGPLPYHALIMKMKAPVANAVKAAMPEDLIGAYGLQEAYFNAMDDYGKRILDASGESKIGASNFLKSITNPGKGELRDKVGQGLVNKARSIKMANDVSKFLPPTEGRTEDVIRAMMAYFGALPTGGASIAVASPAIVGNAAIGIGNLAQKGVTGALKTGIIEGASEPTGKALLIQARKRILGQ